MLTYFMLYLIPFVFALSYSNSLGYENNLEINLKPSLKKWYVIGIIMVLTIGFRFEVGGDWGAYLRHFNAMEYFTFEEILKRSDPGYYSLNWVMSDFGFDIYSVNLICAVIFMIGLIIFSRRQPNPWLALAVAVPYLVTVVAMGYTRQAVALGFVFWGVSALDKGSFKQFIVLVILAATFHKSAVLMIGLGMFLQGNGKIIRAIAVLLVGYGIWSAFLADHQQALWKNYVEVQMQSQGAMIRVIMNLLPAIIFLLYRKKWKQQFSDYSFWFMIALGCLGSLALVNFASTAVDRIALYFTPIQVVVYSRMPHLLRDKFNPQLITVAILLYYLLVLYVWLNYATHAKYWVPYNNILFGVS